MKHHISLRPLDTADPVAQAACEAVDALRRELDGLLRAAAKKQDVFVALGACASQLGYMCREIQSERPELKEMVRQLIQNVQLLADGKSETMVSEIIVERFEEQ